MQPALSNPAPHSTEAERVLQQLDTTIFGLDDTQVQQRREIHGDNLLPEPPRRHYLIRFLAHFHNILIYVLLVSAIITALLQHWIDSAVILAVVVANAIIGFIQEGKAEQAMDAIRQMLSPHATVIRQGQRMSVDSRALVPGDIVILEAGDKVPADLRLLQARSLFIQEAILTGESVAVEKHTAAVSSSAPLGDRRCMAYSGTLVSTGHAKGVVVATGQATEIGRVSGMLASVETLQTPLVLQMGVFAQWITVLILCIATLLLVYGYFVAHFAFGDMFMAVVGLSVAAIPEGLPAVLTITLAIGVQGMARRQAIVRRLPTIETIGAVTVICSDKTGTLTHNEMMVAMCVTPEGRFSLQGEGYEPIGRIEKDGTTLSTSEQTVLMPIARACALCNDSVLTRRDGQWQVEGDPMEGALLAFAEKVGLTHGDETTTLPRTDAIPFDAEYRYMATLHHDHDNHGFVFVKGAPEQVLAMCAYQGQRDALDTDYWLQQANTVAAQGHRVLAIAMRDVTPEKTVLEHNDISHDLTLLGLVGLIDPPRQEAIDAVAECRRAGIAVKMITGDHAATAIAIAGQIGLDHNQRVLTGNDLDELSDVELNAVVMECNVFARTSPEHKLRLVMALQSHNMIVAMTGDGVNDAPALKRADAGIAMGLKGSEAAKEASDLVLADDNFASIAAAVREGRTVYDNLKKVISWTLPTNAGESLTIVVALLFGMSLPITPIQILWINLITAVTLGITLAFEPTEENTMRRPPRPRNQPLLTAGLAWHIVLVSALFLCGVFGIYTYAVDRGYSEELARTLSMNTLVVMEIFHLYFIRNIYGTSLIWKAVRGTKVVWAATIAIVAAQFAITYAPPLQTVFATQAVSLWDGLLVVAIGIALFVIIETEKQIRLAFRRLREH